MLRQKNKVSKAKKRAVKPVEQEYQQNLKMNWVKMVEQRKRKKECPSCVEEIEAAMKKGCSCGPAVIKKELALVGMDAVALFPSMTGRRTAGIVRKRMMMSKMEMNGFNWKKGALYIRMNMNLKIKISPEVRKFLPVRRKTQGVEPRMGSAGLRNKEGSKNN